MDNIEIKIEKVLERDIDFLLINMFITNKNLVSLFLMKVNRSGYKVCNIEHSHYDNGFGESDVTVILTNGEHKIAFLIEDKINALAMPNQYDRYNERGKIGVRNGLYNEFFVFMVAPKQYFETNDEARKYDFQISYEEILESLEDNLYATTLLKNAIEGKKNGYIFVMDDVVTDFWKNYYNFVQNNYSGRIIMDEVKTPKGARSSWFYLRVNSNYKGINIIHKSNQNYVDLSFEQMGNYESVFRKYVKAKNIKRLDKTMVVRIQVPPIDIHTDFSSNIDNMKECMNAVLTLYDLFDMIDVDSMMQEIKGNCLINNISDFRRYYGYGIIVNYDKRVTYRSSKNTVETIANSVDYPFIQRYQKGEDPYTTLFMIKDSVLKKLERVDKNNEDSSYRIVDVEETVSEEFYHDPVFSYPPNPPINIKPELLLEIEDM